MLTRSPGAVVLPGGTTLTYVGRVLGKSKARSLAALLSRGLVQNSIAVCIGSLMNTGLVIGLYMNQAVYPL